ncbi:restriction endonuclease subunit S [Vibrio misgurnus]|uniref:restriction endonuclease subunit S n=1 Tax=Vibrio misgurnus TaxID=2993714 RepID=UPI0023F90F06|nr:restriction endonuclease subunit S [Vibrio sp. VCS]
MSAEKLITESAMDGVNVGHAGAIVDHIDIWTSAVQEKSSSGRGCSKKRELYGIKKLRELILELAVRGKLVPQDPNDEPASVLLERIAAEKAQLIDQGKIKKSKSLIPETKFSTPFELPLGWEWAWLGNVCHIERGGSPRPIKSFLTDAPDGLNWIKIGDTDIGGKYITQTAEKIRPEGLTKTRMVYPGDFLLTNSMSFGRPYITKIEGCIHDGWLRISPPISLDKDYLYNLLSSPFIKQSFSQSAAGAVVMNLNADKVAETLIAIPPTEEQHRIVAKVDELMALCDQLEQQTYASLDAHQVLVETLLATLTNSQDANELMANWARISEHFDILFTTEQSIDQLKQTILQLAVMGKLVPQDPNDEPAAKLLERIAEEKAQLVKEKKIKKQKALPPIAEDEKPFELPKGWEWCRLGSLFSFLNGFAFKSDWFTEQGVKLLRNINIAHSETKWSDLACVSDELAKEYEKFSLNAGDIVISLDRPIINTGLKYAVIEEADLPCLLLQRVAKFSSYCASVNSSYLSNWLESYLFISSIDPGRSNGVPHISTKQLEMLPFPLPPKKQQIKTVSVVDEMIFLCDQLKQRLRDSQQTQLQLTDAIVEQAIV